MVISLSVDRSVHNRPIVSTVFAPRDGLNRRMALSSIESLLPSALHLFSFAHFTSWVAFNIKKVYYFHE